MQNNIVLVFFAFYATIYYEKVVHAMSTKHYFEEKSVRFIAIAENIDTLNGVDNILLPKLFKSYAEIHGLSLSELFRQSVLERIEDEFDLKAYEAALEEYKKNPVSYTHAEICQMLEVE